MSRFRALFLVMALIATAHGCRSKDDRSTGNVEVTNSEEAKKDERQIKRPRGKFTIGKETTYATGPLDKYGYIDYAAALNERLGKGVTPENNAVVLLWKAFGPNPDGGKYPMHATFFRLIGMDQPSQQGEYFIDLSRYIKEHLKLPSGFGDNDKQLQSNMQRPWQAQAFPLLATWVKANEKPLALVIEATKRSQYFSPVVTKEGNGTTTILGARTPGVQACRNAAQALAARAMLRTSEGHYDDAWQDLLACHRLGRLVGRGADMVDGLVGLAVDNIASKADLAFLEIAQLDAKQIQKYLGDLQKLPLLFDMAEKTQLGERFKFLDQIMMLDYAGIDYLQEISAAREPAEKPSTEVARVREQIMDGLDWDPALRNANSLFDRYAVAMRNPNRSEREKQFDRIDEDLKSIKDRLIKSGDIAQLLVGDDKERGKILGDIMISLLVTALRKFSIAHDSTEQTQRNLTLAFALAAHQRENGRYPAALDALTPKYLAKIPDDLFSGKALIYRAGEKSYTLYSVGPNGKDEEGRGREDELNGDDLSVQMPLPKLNDK